MYTAEAIVEMLVDYYKGDSVRDAVKKVILRNNNNKPHFIRYQENREVSTLDWEERLLEQSGNVEDKISVIYHFFQTPTWAHSKTKNKDKFLDFLMYTRAWEFEQTSDESYVDKIERINKMLTDLGYAKLYILSVPDFAIMISIKFKLEYFQYREMLRIMKEKLETIAENNISLKIENQQFTPQLENSFQDIDSLGTPDDHLPDEEETMTAWQFYKLYQKNFARARLTRLFVFTSLIQGTSLLDIFQFLNSDCLPKAPAVSMSASEVKTTIDIIAREISANSNRASRRKKIESFLKNIPLKALIDCIIYYIDGEQLRVIYDHREQILNANIHCHESDTRNVFYLFINNIIEKCGYVTISFQDAQSVFSQHPYCELSYQCEAWKSSSAKGIFDKETYHNRPLRLTPKKEYILKDLLMEYIEEETEDVL